MGSIGEHKHRSTLNTLTKASVVNEFHSIPNVDRNKYRKFLECAIKESDSYKGINTDTIGSFYKQDMEQRQSGQVEKTMTQEYLEILNSQSMPSKCRVFVIDDSNRTVMEEELNGERTEGRDFYNDKNHNVNTYWITVDELRSEYNVNGVSDCAIFDDRLMLSYCEEKQILTFSLIDQNSRDPNYMVFSHLDTQLDLNLMNPFRTISFPSSSEGLHNSRSSPPVSGELLQTTLTEEGSSVSISDQSPESTALPQADELEEMISEGEESS